ncbi:hypothetical protein HDU89_008495 [Geranomyces variabilis]|nr:hypothetical protein HDU89_008495 [Geranomyces variabilis]
MPSGGRDGVHVRHPRAAADLDVAAYLKALPKSTTFGKLVELRLKSDDWWKKHFTFVKKYSGLQRLSNIDETLVAPASSLPTGPESIAIDEPRRWLGISADEQRERIEADIDDKKSAQLADVPPDTGTHEPLVLVPDSQSCSCWRATSP